jgi:RNA polymerase sigma-70 factor (ECF subfamily)
LNAIPPEIHPALVRQAQDGDREGLRKLVEAAYPRVRRWALVRTGDPTEADDLTQDVMIHMIRKLDGYKWKSAFGTWLYSVTRNAAADRFRRARRRSRLTKNPIALAHMTPDTEAAPDATLGRSSMVESIREFFMELPLRQREVFDLVELQGLTSPEAAERLGIEAVSVRAHLFRARKTLRTRILRSRPELVEDLP